MKWAYTAVVSPALSYASNIWCTNLTESKKNELRKINRLACLMIGKVQKSTTPTAGLEVIYDIEPLHIYLDRKAVSTILRLRNKIRNFWSGEGKTKRKGHLKIWEQKIKQWNLLQDFNRLGMDDKQEIKIWIKRFKLNELIKKQWSEDLDKVYIYTDGSKTKDGVGFGYFIKSLRGTCKEAFKLGDHNLVFQAEILAIKEAASLASDRFYNEDIIIRSDSQAAIMAINSSRCYLDCILQAIVQLNKLGVKNKVTIEWICSHNDLTPEGNNEADLLAKQGTMIKDSFVALPPTKCIGKTGLKKKVIKCGIMNGNEQRTNQVKKFIVKQDFFILRLKTR